MAYRTHDQISDEEFLGALTAEWQFQKEIFVALGGDPTDHDYARLSFKTSRLREQGHAIETSRRYGVRLAP